MGPHWDTVADDVVNMGYEMLCEDQDLPHEERIYPDRFQKVNYDPYPQLCRQCNCLGCRCKSKPF